MAHWLIFAVSMGIAYMGIALFGQLSGDKGTSALSAFLTALRPLPFLIITIANMFFALGLFYGFKVTRYAIPIAISSGVIISFLYSVFVMGTSITITKVIGVVTILVGIVILAY